MRADNRGLLFCKTNIAGLFFDGFTNVSHSRELTITEHQVETGSSIVDHAFMRPNTVSMRIFVSDVQGRGSFRNHQEAWKTLKRLQEARIPFSIFTKLDLYDNMLIETLNAVDTPETNEMLVADITMREIPVVSMRTIGISPASQDVYSSNIGTVNAQRYVPQSMLSLLYGAKGGR